MNVTRKFDIVIFRIKKFVVEQLKQEEYREDLFHKEILILEYLSIFSKKLLHNLKEKSHHQEKLIEYSSLSHSGIFGVHYSPPHKLISPISLQQQQVWSIKLIDTGDSDDHDNLHDYPSDHISPLLLNTPASTTTTTIKTRRFSEDNNNTLVHRDSILLDKKLSDSPS